MAERALWEPLPGERPKAFAAFELYRQLGPGRTVEEAWRRYWCRPGARHRSPEPAPPRVMPYFSQWATGWRWQERALAWDAEQAEIERDRRLDRELQERAREHEEEIRQRQLMREEARAARAVARRVLLRTLQQVEAGQLDQMNLPELLPYLPKAATLLDIGQKLDRLFAEEPAEALRHERETETLIARLVELMKEFVPPERWADLAARLEELED